MKARLTSCPMCGSRELYAKGLCNNCYQRLRRRLDNFDGAWWDDMPDELKAVLNEFEEKTKWEV